MAESSVQAAISSKSPILVNYPEEVSKIILILVMDMANTALIAVKRSSTSSSPIVFPEKSISNVVKALKPVKVGKEATSTPTALIVKSVRVVAALASAVPKLGIASEEKSKPSKVTVNVVKDEGLVLISPKHVVRSLKALGAAYKSIT